MPVTRLVALNNNAGAYTAIAATLAARRVEIVEDGSVAGQGLEVQYPGDSFSVTNTVAADSVITLIGPGHDGLAGLPEQNAGDPGGFNHRAADIYCQLRSATATGTTVRVVETEGDGQ